MNLFYYGAQRVAVQSLTDQLIDHANVRFHTVWTHEQLYGHEDLNFIIVDEHPMPVPDRMLEVLKARGCIIWHVNDRHTRRGRLVAERG